MKAPPPKPTPGAKRGLPISGAGAMGLCGLVATLFTGALIPHCSSQSYAQGRDDGRAEAAAEIRETEQHTQALRAELTQTAGVVNELQESLAALRERIDAADADLAGCRETLSECLAGSGSEETIASLRHEIERLRAERDEAIEQRAVLRAQLNTTLAREQGKDEPPGPAAAGDAPFDPMVAGRNGVEFVLRSARRSANGVELELTVTSTDRDRKVSIHTGRRSYFWDSNGVQTEGTGGTFGTNANSTMASVEMVRGVTVPLTLRFPLDPNAGAVAPKMIIATSVGEVEFRDVPMTP